MTCADPLGRLVAKAARLVPGLEGEVINVPAPGIHVAARHAPGIEKRFRRCQETFPDAGRHYHLMHCWGRLIWQPIFVCVVAAYHADCVPRLRHMYLPVADDTLPGYAIRRHIPLYGDQAQRIRRACAQLRPLCAGISCALARLTRVNCVAMSCMQADCVLEALLAAHGRTCHAAAQLRQRARLWLSLMGLEGKSDYFEYRRQEELQLAVLRQSCCHRFRCDGARHCRTCPKLNVEERVIRLITGRH